IAGLRAGQRQGAADLDRLLTLRAEYGGQVQAGQRGRAEHIATSCVQHDVSLGPFAAPLRGRIDDPIMRVAALQVQARQFANRQWPRREARAIWFDLAWM